ncbi:transaldolase family protein [Neobacillus vireti]|uniref:Transaldolase n=1 Tax=Neobacillus vireti LMG 21834 TaxID=1131730 RepID=A0AB94IJ01_9BACI|nr:transaldolase family protein [Neobacillus vireti]ETI67051.1 putative transaldolase [Neobacillus vireti LMG 21834]KLT18020.1 transaldolase [Neobacillus vireti]
MKLFIDSADVKQIAYLNEYYPISGVTTNPSLIVRENRPYLELLKEIREAIGEEKELFVQVIGDKAEEMVEEAKFVRRQVSGELVIKVPVTEEGIKAIKLLTAENIPTLATTIYTSFQALVAAMAGAKYVAPYVNRIDNLTGGGVKVVSEISSLFSSYQLSTEIIAASFKNVQQVHDVCLAGAESVTVGPELIEKFIAFPATPQDVTVFKEEWQGQYGKDQANLIIK